MILNIIIFILIVVIAYALVTYNKLVKLDNKVSEYESGIDVLLKRRFDLIPNLVECVKGYSKHENTLLNEITELRTDYQRKNVLNVEKASELNNKINNVLAVSENYPELKANESFINLQNNLNEIENSIIDARLLYNRAVTTYNNMVETVPSDFIAKIFFFDKKDLFKIDSEEKKNIDVKFN